MKLCALTAVLIYSTEKWRIACVTFTLSQKSFVSIAPLGPFLVLLNFIEAIMFSFSILLEHIPSLSVFPFFTFASLALALTPHLSAIFAAPPVSGRFIPLQFSYFFNTLLVRLFLYELQFFFRKVELVVKNFNLLPRSLITPLQVFYICLLWYFYSSVLYIQGKASYVPNRWFVALILLQIRELFSTSYS